MSMQSNKLTKKINIAAITIACGQVKNLFGMPGRSSEFIETVRDFIHDIHTIKLWDSVLGVSMIVFIMCLWVSCKAE